MNLVYYMKYAMRVRWEQRKQVAFVKYRKIPEESAIKDDTSSA